MSRSRWPHGLIRRDVGAPLMGLRVRIPPKARMSVSRKWCVCCQAEISATGRSFVQRSVVCLSVISKPQKSGGLDPLGLSSHKRWNNVNKSFYNSKCNTLHYETVDWHRISYIMNRTRRRDKFWRKKKVSPFGTEHAHCGRSFNFSLRLLCVVFILLMWREVTISIHMWGLHCSQSVPSARSVQCQQDCCLCQNKGIQNNEQDLPQCLR